MGYHPLLASIAETGCCIGAKLRPGDHGIGERDVPMLEAWLKRLQGHVGSEVMITVRMDSAGDCAELLTALDNLKLRFVIKLKADQALVDAALGQKRWSITERDEAGQPTERVAVLHFARKGWLNVTNDWQLPPEEIAREYDGRAEIETIIRQRSLEGMVHRDTGARKLCGPSALA